MERQRQEEFSYAPLISIVVPVYQAPEEFLTQMLLSVCRQTYKTGNSVWLFRMKRDAE